MVEKKFHASGSRKGTEATVFEGTGSNIGLVCKCSTDHSALTAQYEAQLQISHPSVPKVRCLGQSGAYAVLIEERLHGLTVEEALEVGLSDTQVLIFLSRFVEVLVSVHTVHGDLHLRNVLIEPGMGEVGVIDWGSVGGPDGRVPYNRFTLPEVRVGEEAPSRKADLYSAVMIARYLLEQSGHAVPLWLSELGSGVRSAVVADTRAGYRVVLHHTAALHWTPQNWSIPAWEGVESLITFEVCRRPEDRSAAVKTQLIAPAALPMVAPVMISLWSLGRTLLMVALVLGVALVGSQETEAEATDWLDTGSPDESPDDSDQRSWDSDTAEPEDESESESESEVEEIVDVEPVEADHLVVAAVIELVADVEAEEIAVVEVVAQDEAIVAESVPEPVVPAAEPSFPDVEEVDAVESLSLEAPDPTLSALIDNAAPPQQNGCQGGEFRISAPGMTVTNNGDSASGELCVLPGTRFQLERGDVSFYHIPVVTADVRCAWDWSVEDNGEWFFCTDTE